MSQKLMELIKEPGGAWEEVKAAVGGVSDQDAEELVADLLRQAQEALTQEQAELVLLLRSPDDLAVVTFNTLGLITSVCKNSADLLGHPVEGLIGQPIDAILYRRSKQVEQSTEEMRKAEEGPRVQSVRTHQREDGTRFDAAHGLVAVVGRQERVTGFVREIHDVTGYRACELRIAELDRVIAFLMEEEAEQGAVDNS
jgi:two-component system CheB/CheR fusion protein